MSNIKLPKNLKGVHLHFVGIKGTGMAALVEIAVKRGAIITGSDVSERFYTDQVLENVGIKAVEFSESNITDQIQFVIYSSAYNPEKNPDLIAAKKKNLPMLLYSEALGCLSESAYSCAVCGVHGKTTTTGLAGTILSKLPMSAQILAGSQITSFGGNCTLTNEAFENSTKNENNQNFLVSQNIFVAETCEYQRHFMAFSPEKIILTSVESDHQDYYPTFDDIQDAFVDFICKLPQNGALIFCADDEGAVETAQIAKCKRPDINFIPYGENAEIEDGYKLTFGLVKNGEQEFSVEYEGGKSNFKILVPGQHLVRNATAAIALNFELLKENGLNPNDYIEDISKGLTEFKGGKRRSEVVGSAKNSHGNSIIFIDDYGHHPTAIRTTLAGYRDFYKGRKIIVDFMSHTYSRTQSLFEEFATSFDSADQIIFHKIYSSAREKSSDFSVTGEKLFERAKEKYGEKIAYFEEILDAKPFAKSLLEEKSSEKFPEGYLFVTMGAGDNWKIGKELLEEFKS